MSAMKYEKYIVQGVTPEMKKMSEKYPELKDKENLPAELEPIAEKSETMGKNMVGTFMKLAKYMDDPDVAAALARLDKAMRLM